jgi:ElaB/YqjD/DUF883 family membrane-anchored ribosome-binding protein
VHVRSRALDECDAIADPEYEMTNESAGETPPSREEELARKAAKLVKQGRPQLERFIARTRPQAEKAGKQAAQYVREHESEIKDAALKLAQTRLPGPLGMAAGALANGMSSQPGAKAGACPNCAAQNPPAANFCNECGTKLTTENPST